MAMKKDEFLTYDEETGRVTKDAEQAVRDDVEKNRWKLTLATIVKDWRLYLMLVPMLLVFLFGVISQCMNCLAVLRLPPLVKE